MLASAMINMLVDAMVARNGDFVVEPEFIRRPENFTVNTMELKTDTITKAYEEGKKYGTMPDSDVEHLPPMYKRDSEEGMAWTQGFLESFHGADPEASAF